MTLLFTIILSFFKFYIVLTSFFPFYISYLSTKYIYYIVAETCWFWELLFLCLFLVLLILLWIILAFVFLSFQNVPVSPTKLHILYVNWVAHDILMNLGLAFHILKVFSKDGSVLEVYFLQYFRGSLKL